GFKEKDKFDELLDSMYNMLDESADLLRPNQALQYPADKETKQGKKRIDILQQMLSSIDSQISRLKKQGNKPQADKLEETHKTLEKLVKTNRSQAVVRY